MPDNTRRLNVAFYAPLKPPDHPIASGDREIARLIIAALENGNVNVDLASHYIAYQKRPGDELFETRKAGALAEREVLLSVYQSGNKPKPDIWLTYHSYCKAPDWLGPEICRALKIPYTTVEACRTRQNLDTDWQAGRDIVQAGIRQAAANFCTKASDRDYLDTVLASAETIVPLAPFIDVAALQALETKTLNPFANDDPVILAVGMMRPNAKQQSYEYLSAALRMMTAQRYNLVIIGDGPQRVLVENLFGFLPSERVHFTGSLAKNEVAGWMRTADILAWPGYREAIGLVFLEAAALGLPIAAMASLGVPSVVADRVGGLLVPEGDVKAYAETLTRLLADATLRNQMQMDGRKYVSESHSLSAATQTLLTTFNRLLDRT